MLVLNHTPVGKVKILTLEYFRNWKLGTDVLFDAGSELTPYDVLGGKLFLIKCAENWYTKLNCLLSFGFGDGLGLPAMVEFGTSSGFRRLVRVSVGFWAMV